MSPYPFISFIQDCNLMCSIHYEFYDKLNIINKAFVSPLLHISILNDCEQKRSDIEV